MGKTIARRGKVKVQVHNVNIAKRTRHKTFMYEMYKPLM
jgi:hypothetical protein